MSRTIVLMMHHNLHSIAKKHYELDVDGDTYKQIMDKLVKHFASMKKFKPMVSNPNCKKCYGRGFSVPSNGDRLVPCSCWRTRK